MRSSINIKRLLPLVLWFVFIAFLAAPTIASADTSLCSGMNYSACVNAGYTDHGYGANSANRYWQMDPGHNCTNYTAFAEQTVNGAPTPSYLLGDASTWGTNAQAHGVLVDGNPKPGAVAWWKNGDHVAYVESVNTTNGAITISEDAWPSGPFDWRVINPGSSSWPNGFIHFKDLASNGGSGGGGTTTPRTLGDFTGDGSADLAVFRRGDGSWHVRGYGDFAYGYNIDIPVPGDYNNDGKTEIAVYRPTDGSWHIRGYGDFAYGQPGDIPVPADYNGDGSTDMAVYRPGDGSWHIRGYGDFSYGQPGDIPVPADYNNDGRAEIAVFRPVERPGESAWHIRGVGDYQYGIPGDIPVPGDYNGDGRADMAVFRSVERPGESAWHIRDVGDYQYGIPGDVPVPADYNNDGHTEIAVFRPVERPGESAWHIRNVGDYQYGVPGDVPATTPMNAMLLRQFGFIP